MQMAKCSTGTVLQQRNFCPRSWCASTEQPVFCKKMNGDEDDHARRWVECQQTVILALLKRVTGVRQTHNLKFHSFLKRLKCSCLMTAKTTSQLLLAGHLIQSVSNMSTQGPTEHPHGLQWAAFNKKQLVK